MERTWMKEYLLPEGKERMACLQKLPGQERKSGGQEHTISSRKAITIRTMLQDALYCKADRIPRQFTAGGDVPRKGLSHVRNV